MNKKRSLLLILAFLMTIYTMSQKTFSQTFWTGGTALTLPDKRLELRLFGLSSYGLTDRIEISAHPVMFWLMPQVKVKYRLSEKGVFTITSEHQLNYPTILLNILSRKGIGGMISPEFDFPQMISFYNGIIITRKIAANSSFTGKAGILFALRSGAIDKRSTIDLPVIYPRLATYYHSPVLNPGIDFRGNIFSSIGGQLSVECFVIPGGTENFFLENKGLLTWTLKTKWQFQAGYRLCYGTYPYGTQWHLLPAFEIMTGF
jgi:hypothetical protein